MRLQTVVGKRPHAWDRTDQTAGAAGWWRWCTDGGHPSGDAAVVVPAGVIADVFDRRWCVVAGSLALLTLSGLMTPVLMLVFTHLLPP